MLFSCRTCIEARRIKVTMFGWTVYPDGQLTDLVGFALIPTSFFGIRPG